MIRAVVMVERTVRRTQLVRALEHDRDIAVVGQPHTHVETVAIVSRLRPDLVVLDLAPDEQAAVHTIGQIMAHVPTPILVISARTNDHGAPSAVEALVAGALDALPASTFRTVESAGELRRTARQLSRVPVIRHPRGGRAIRPPREALHAQELRPVVAMAASTGGPAALATILAGLDGLAAPVLVVQHLHPDFTSGLLDWMSRVSALPVEIARHGVVVRPGRVYLAAGGAHLRLGAQLRVDVDPMPVATHRPSADELFKSVAEQAGVAGVGVLLTGMGDDGARGLRAMRDRGAQTLAQDEESSAVFGMPQAAHRLGAVSSLLPLGQLAAAIRRAVRGVTEVPA